MERLKRLFCIHKPQQIDEISNDKTEQIVKETMDELSEKEISQKEITIEVEEPEIDKILQRTEINYIGINTVAIVDGNTLDVSVIKSTKIPRIMLIEDKLEKLKELYKLMNIDFPFSYD